MIIHQNKEGTKCFNEAAHYNLVWQLCVLLDQIKSSACLCKNATIIFRQCAMKGHFRSSIFSTKANLLASDVRQTIVFFGAFQSHDLFDVRVRSNAGILQSRQTVLISPDQFSDRRNLLCLHQEFDTFVHHNLESVPQLKQKFHTFCSDAFVRWIDDLEQSVELLHVNVFDWYFLLIGITKVTEEEAGEEWRVESERIC